MSETTKKGNKGSFRPGQSGNPNGRPKGARNRASVIAAELLDGDAAELVSRAIELAKGGHPVALKLCIERLVPRSGARVHLDLPKLARAEDVAAGLQAVIEAAAAGEITLDEAERFAWLLESARKTIETSELAIRIESLEAAAKQEEMEKKRRYGYGLKREK